jgi:Uri superfamily endonuclease
MAAPMKGTYVLLMHLDIAINIQAGKRRFYLDSGFYGYVGSALSGIEKRVGRHLSSEKRAYWHIVLSISEMGHFLNRTLFDNQTALASSLRPWL